MKLIVQSLTNLLSSKNLCFHLYFFEFQKQLFLFESNLDKKLKKEKRGSVFIIGAILSDLLNSKFFSENIFQQILEFLFETENLTYESLFQTIEIFLLCENLSSEEKKTFQLFKNFVSNSVEKEEFLSSSESQKSTFPKKYKKKIYSLYRITYSPSKKFISSPSASEPNLCVEDKKYYCGYRGTSLRPVDDVSYLGSSDTVRNLKKNSEKDCFQKKILGIFLFEDDAIEAEVSYHHFFDVKNHPKFLNKANQTSKKFSFDNTGRVHTKESNRKHSETQKGKIVSEDTRNKIRNAHLTRERSEEETRNRAKNMKRVSQMRKLCPHCQKEAPPSAGKRWHFDNCLKNPNLTPERKKELEAQREVLRENARLRNKTIQQRKKKNNQNE